MDGCGTSVKVRRPHVYEAVAWKSPAPGASDTRKVELHGYAKLNSVGGPLCVANEYICSRIGDRLSIPVPPGAVIAADAGKKAWLTLSFTPTTLPPIDAADVATRVPRLAAEVVVFDILIANTDRHAGNLAFRSADRRLEVFDHGHALMGAGPAAGVSKFQGFANALAIDGAAGNRHCLLDLLTSVPHVMAAVELVEANLTDAMIRRITEEAKLLRVGFSEAGPLADALILRRSRIRDLIRKASHEFKGIPTAEWSSI